MESNVVVSLYHWDERDYLYSYFVEDGEFFVEIEDTEEETVKLESVDTFEAWEKFLNIFESYYCSEEFADEKLDEFVEGLPLLKEAGVESLVVEHDNGNGEIYLKTPVQLFGLYFNQEEDYDGPDREMFYTSGDYAVEQLKQRKEGLKQETKGIEVFETLLTA